MRETSGTSHAPRAGQLTLTIRDVAGVLNCSAQKVCALIDNGVLRAMRWGGHRRVATAELDRFISKRESAVGQRAT